MEKYLELKKWYKSGFDSFESGLNGEKKSSIHASRISAIKSFEEQQFPTQKNEEWKYTNLSSLLEKRLSLASKAEISIDEITPILLTEDEFKIVIVNGFYNKELSSSFGADEGIEVVSLKDAFANKSEIVTSVLGTLAKKENNIFTALNEAYLTDGVLVDVKKNKEISKPIHILRISKTAEDSNIIGRNLIVCEDNSNVELVESFISLSDTSNFNNVVTEVILKAGSKVEHIKIQDENSKSFHIARTEISQAKDSNYVSYNINFGGKLVRNDINTVFESEGCFANLKGLYIAHNDQIVDNHTSIDHKSPNCESHELYKGVLDGKARGIFNGKVLVRKDAQKTNAFQQNNTILLSDDARIDTKPQLEIFADDVKCSHGATIGRLDNNSLFYLRSRGIGYSIAKGILINAFAAGVLEGIKHSGVKARLEKLIYAKLGSSF